MHNRRRGAHAKIWRKQGAVSRLSLYFRLVVLAARVRTVHETQDHVGVVPTCSETNHVYRWRTEDPKQVKPRGGMQRTRHVIFSTELINLLGRLKDHAP